MSQAGKLTESGKGEARGRLMTVHYKRSRKAPYSWNFFFLCIFKDLKGDLAGRFPSRSYCILGEPKKLFRLL